MNNFCCKRKHKLSYYAVDLDNNLLNMTTLIHMEKRINNEWIPIDVSTSEFSLIRNDPDWRLLNDNKDNVAFSEFRDNGPRGKKAFIEDAINAINKNDFAPSWKSFIKCLIDGSLFAIITARGNHPSIYKEFVEYVIDNVLSIQEKILMYNNCLEYTKVFNIDEKYDYHFNINKISQTKLIQHYLEQCHFYGVSSPHFLENFGEGNARNPEKAKELALECFINTCIKFGNQANLNVSIGFSDDDTKNVNHIKNYFKEISLKHTNLKLNIYDTSNENFIRTKYLNGEII